jgi:hypothetical protein
MNRAERGALVTRIVVTGLVAVHLAATLWHGSAHGALAITLPPAKNVFVWVVIILAPLVAAALVWTRHLVTGVGLFAAAMLGALLFGVYHHYVLVSPDNVGHLPSGSPEAHAEFVASAATIALLELASALYGAFCLGRAARGEAPARAARGGA